MASFAGVDKSYIRIYACDNYRSSGSHRRRRPLSTRRTAASWRLTRYGSPFMIGVMNITWQQLIQDLRDSGMPMCVIAKRCDLSPQAVTDIGSGRTAEPKGFAAVKMYALHARRMRSKKKAA